MNKKYFFFLAFFSICLAALFSLLIHYSHAADIAGQPIIITAADLTSAGFTNAQVADPANNRFITPPYYFTVAEKADLTSEAPNIVMVSILSTVSSPSQLPYTYGTNNSDFTINGGIGKEGTMSDDRVAINFFKGNNYVVIIGPDKQKIEQLATIVANKIQ